VLSILVNSRSKISRGIQDWDVKDAPGSTLRAIDDRVTFSFSSNRDASIEGLDTQYPRG